MTQDEYIEWKTEQAEREQFKKRKKKKRKPKEVEEDVEEDINFVPEFQFSLSPTLKKDYGVGKKRVYGYDIVPLTDTFRERICAVASMRMGEHGDLALAHSPRISALNRKHGWGRIYDLMQQRYGVPDKARLYKVKFQNIRGIVSVNSRKIDLLEILTHEDYELFQDKKSQ